VPKHEEKLTGAWRQLSTLRRQYEKWCKGDDIEDCTHKQQYEASYQSTVKVLQQNTWIDDRKFLKSCVRARAEQGNINNPAYGTWTADFMLRQNESKSVLREEVSRAKWRMLKKCLHETRFARRPVERLPYPTLTGGHQVCITRKGDPALRLLTNCGQENHLCASSVSPTEAHLDLR